MRGPIRKGGKYTFDKADHNITEDKFEKLTRRLKKLKDEIRPPLIKEVKMLALDGDFSENAGYQIAKGRLRGTNSQILKIEKYINNAKIIRVNKNSGIVQLGSTVTVEINKKKRTFQILGSAETNPNKGVISHNSPIGMALLNKRIGDVVKIKLAEREVEYKIIEIG